MLTKRIIPCLDVRDDEVVKGIQFKNHKYVGSITNLAQKYSNDGADVSADGGAFTTFGGKFHNDQYEDAGDEELDVYSSSYAQLCRSHGG